MSDERAPFFVVIMGSDPGSVASSLACSRLCEPQSKLYRLLYRVKKAGRKSDLPKAPKTTQRIMICFVLNHCQACRAPSIENVTIAMIAPTREGW